MTIEYGTLKNANVTIDSGDGAVWLCVTSGNEHAGINLSAQITDPAIDEVVKQWAEFSAKNPGQMEPLRRAAADAPPHLAWNRSYMALTSSGCACMISPECCLGSLRCTSILGLGKCSLTG